MTRNNIHIDYTHKTIYKRLADWEKKHGLIIEKILLGDCINCQKSRRECGDVFYATTSAGKVVWWCR